MISKLRTLAPQKGLEPPTLRLEGACSSPAELLKHIKQDTKFFETKIQISIVIAACVFNWLREPDSNWRLKGYEPCLEPLHISRDIMVTPTGLEPILRA